MLEKNFSLCDYLVFGLLLVASSMIGVFFAWRGRKTPSADQFFTGNRKLGLFPVTLSLVASFMSTNTLLGVPAEVYQVGTQFVMQNISIVVAIFLAAEVFMPVYHDLGLTSINEYLEKRFESKAIKLLGTIGFLLATVRQSKIKILVVEINKLFTFFFRPDALHGRRALRAGGGARLGDAALDLDLDPGGGHHLHLLHFDRKSIGWDSVTIFIILSYHHRTPRVASKPSSGPTCCSAFSCSWAWPL